ncbi:hypothetical protein B0T25DRAFT_565734 [Lasiosphaeria hispida]|uniref:F-box domain-containing protein n=1 Tax=Lasiosphaeria hispida TaxID=260671 RepID=A0AAJ0HK29_9PEZI|nr:hypothetical protein B0T25DRAFT_565734 [Lasiosphaeria hispida]
MEGSSAASSPTVGLAEKPAITSMPFEILTKILWCDELTQCDVKAARLTCHALATAAADRLFLRIYVSKLVTDRDSFLAICNSLHLAVHVREVEWLEISYALGGFEWVHPGESAGRLTSRNGEVGYSDDPLEWFEKWDLKAGDKEEPTPPCNALRDFVAAEGQAPGLSNISEEAWNFMRHLRPPLGAVEYDEASYVDDI